MVGHVEPEAACGGPIALVHEGDHIRICVEDRRIDLLVADSDLARRRSAWTAPEPKCAPGTVLGKYAARVGGPSHGALVL